MSDEVKHENPADAPLQIAVEGDQLVIRIGISTLGFAAEHCERFYDDAKHASSGPPYVTVGDRDEFVADVIAELSREQEDGATPLHVLFDSAFEAAFENGSLGFADEDYE